MAPLAHHSEHWRRASPTERLTLEHLQGRAAASCHLAPTPLYKWYAIILPYRLVTPARQRAGVRGAAKGVRLVDVALFTVMNDGRRRDRTLRRLRAIARRGAIFAVASVNPAAGCPHRESEAQVTKVCGCRSGTDGMLASSSGPARTTLNPVPALAGHLDAFARGHAKDSTSRCFPGVCRHRRDARPRRRPTLAAEQRHLEIWPTSIGLQPGRCQSAGLADAYLRLRR